MMQQDRIGEADGECQLERRSTNSDYNAPGHGPVSMEYEDSGLRGKTVTRYFYLYLGVILALKCKIPVQPVLVIIGHLLLVLKKQVLYTLIQGIKALILILGCMAFQYVRFLNSYEIIIHLND